MSRVERRESTRLQSAAKLLRSLSKSKDKVEAAASAASETPSMTELDRTFPAYQSEGKGVRRRKSAKAVASPSTKGKFGSYQNGANVINRWRFHCSFVMD